MVVIGGFSHGDKLSRVEVFDLEDATKTCSPISDYPTEISALSVGVVQAIIKACGGNNPPDKVCYDYVPESDTWISTSSLTQVRRYHGASLIQDVWLISGGEPIESSEWHDREVDREFFRSRTASAEEYVISLPTDTE